MPKAENRFAVTDEDDHVENVQLEDCDMEQERARHKMEALREKQSRRGEQYDEDDEDEGGGGGGPQCRQQ